MDENILLKIMIITHEINELIISAIIKNERDSLKFKIKDRCEEIQELLDA
jgi:hypothetical protein